MDSLSKITGSDEVCASGEELQLPILERCALVRSQKASRVTWHAHDAIEVLIALEGSTEYEFGDGHTEVLAGGQYLAIPPGVRHRGKHDIRRPARLLGLIVNPSARNAVKNTPFTAKDLRWLSDQLTQGAGHSYRIHGDLREPIRALSAPLPMIRSASAPILISIRLAICAILLELANQAASSRRVEPKNLVKQAIEYMKQHLQTDASIEQVAKEVRCSRAKLFALFKESTGMTPNDYWLRLRVDHAQRLLRTTQLPVITIAMQSGFSSSQYFSTVFKKYVGTSPSIYRDTACSE